MEFREEEVRKQCWYDCEIRNTGSLLKTWERRG
jgi:hypothetical protein